MEHARARGETAIGWLSGNGPLHLAPAALERNTYKDGDRIIVVRWHSKFVSCLTRLRLETRWMCSCSTCDTDAKYARVLATPKDDSMCRQMPGHAAGGTGSCHCGQCRCCSGCGEAAGTIGVVRTRYCQLWWRQHCDVAGCPCATRRCHAAWQLAALYGL